MDEQLEQIEGVVEDIIYENEDNGYVVFEISGGGVLTVVCGIVGELHAGKASSAAAGTKTMPPMAASSTRRNARPICPRIWKRCTPFWPAVLCRISAQKLRIRSLICSGLKRWRLSPTTPPA